jgi:uncharacterized OB-fold protein
MAAAMPGRRGRAIGGKAAHHETQGDFFGCVQGDDIVFPPVIEIWNSDTLGGDGASSAEPQPDSDHLSRCPQGGVLAGELYFQRCNWCRTAVFQRLLCPVCTSTDMSGERSEGVGVVRHVAVVGRSTGTPHALAIIEMSEGFRLRARVVAALPDTVRTGARVRLATDATPGVGELIFRQ